MSILITGSSSYIGKNLINFLEKKKISYIGIDLCKPYTKKCFKVNILEKNIEKKIKKKNYINSSFSSSIFRSVIQKEFEINL